MGMQKAMTIPAGNFTKIAKKGSNISTTLAADAKTINGDLIENEVAYKVFVMTVAADPNQFLNSLSIASGALSLDSGDKVKVTYIANDGVMIDFQGKKVAIDAINRSGNLNGWISPSNAELTAVENGDPPYNDIDVIMITHNHGDHYSTSAVQSYLAKHPNTKLIVPSRMKSSFSAYANRMPNFSLQKFDRVNVILNEISIDVLRVEHFDQFGNDFSGVESYTYVVDMGGKKFMHTGDLDYVDSRLGDFNLLEDSITVAFIPTFGNLVNSNNRDSLLNNVNPKHIVGLHFLSASLSTSLSQINTIYPGADALTLPFETRKY